MLNKQVKDISKDVVVEGRTFAFLFSKIVASNSNKYFVSACCGIGDEAKFEMMQSKDGNWKILPPAPRWVCAIEKTLSAIIKDSLSAT